MAEIVKWEYIVRGIGSLMRAPKDEEIEALLNELGEQGWELAAAVPMTNSGAVIKLVGKRPLTMASRRRRSIPGMEERV